MTEVRTETLMVTIRSFRRHIKGYWPLYGTIVSIAGLFWSTAFLLVLEFNLYFIFRNTLNKLQIVGPIYWITKNNVSKAQPVVAVGFMHETSEPWRAGKGIQVRFGSRSFHVGICKKHDYDEVSGILSATKGRFLELSPSDIGTNYKSSARKIHETLE